MVLRNKDCFEAAEDFAYNMGWHKIHKYIQLKWKYTVCTCGS